MIKSILVADESPTIRRVVELTFSDSEFHVESVDSGAAAVRVLGTLSPDLVLADVDLCEPSGYEICRRIKESGRPVPVILLTSAFEDLDEERARNSGADGHLTKPFDTDLLYERAGELLAEAGAEAAIEDVSAGQTAELPRTAGLSAEEIDAIAGAVVRRLSVDVIRDVAREVVPEVARRLVLERIRELEEEGRD